MPYKFNPLSGKLDYYKAGSQTPWTSNINADGYTLNGDDASGGNLTLQSTSNATKGKILFGTSAYDEVNNRLGIGTTAPNELLEVSGSSGAVRLTDTNTAGVGRFRFYENSTNIGDFQFVGSTHAATTERNWMEFVNRTATGGVSFWTNSTQQMSINSSGNVGIGTTAPGAKLDILGGYTTTGWPLKIENAGYYAAYFKGTDANNQTSFYMDNDRGSFASYGGFLYGGSASTLGNLFEQTRTDKLFMFADGASNLGMIVGTLRAQPFIIGTNNLERVRVNSAGNVGIGITAPTSRIHGVTTLSAATGNEIAYQLNYTTNKATSGNDTGLLINQTDTASPGTSLLQDWQVGGVSKFNVDNTGITTQTGKSVATQFQVSALNTAPANASDTGILGEIRITAGYIYVCSATNTWVRAALTTW